MLHIYSELIIVIYKFVSERYARTSFQFLSSRVIISGILLPERCNYDRCLVYFRDSVYTAGQEHLTV